MDVTACNYNCSTSDNSDSIIPCNDGVDLDDGSCTYPSDDVHDCSGNCTAITDCHGDCNGSAYVDNCGVCCAGDTNVACTEQGACTECYDYETLGCDNVCYPTGYETIVDQCGVCGGDDTSCADCAGTPNGSAALNICGVCNNVGIVNSSSDCMSYMFTENFVNNECCDNCGVPDGDNSTCSQYQPDFIKGFGVGGNKLDHRQYVAFTLPPRDTLMCINNPSWDVWCNESGEEFGECGDNPTSTGGMCVQYEIDRTLKASVYASLEDVASNTKYEDAFTNNDYIFTQQYDDVDGTPYNTGIYYSSFKSSFYKVAGVRYFEPGKGYFIEFFKDVYLYWREP